MQRALIVYNPQQAPSDHAGARQGFAAFLRHGGRARPMPMGDEAGNSWLPQKGDLESSTPSDPEVVKILRAQSRFTCATNCAIITVLVFAVCVFLALSASIIAMRNTVDSLAESVLPHADQVVDATVQTMHDVGGSMLNMRKITQMTSEFAQKDLGPNGAAGKTLNATSIVAERLARLLEHPTIQLSLGG